VIAEGEGPVEAARFGALAGAVAVTRREVVPGLGTRAELDAFAAARS
jgi:sugar/nucleoside kinase (ribokinase family)